LGERPLLALLRHADRLCRCPVHRGRSEVTSERSERRDWHFSDLVVWANVGFAPTAAVPYRSFRELRASDISASSTFGLANEILASRYIGPPVKLQRVQISMLTLIALRFSLISRCTRRAHAAF
jgi:hypothetical protein